jgi:hypothetical protein
MARNFVRTSTTVGDHIDCGNASALNPANNLSVCAWVYPTGSAALDVVQFLVTRDTGLGGSAARAWQVFRNSSNQFVAAVFKTGPTSTAATGTTAASSSVWYHVCLTYKFVTDGTSELRIYVDGVQEASSTAAVGPINQTTNPVQIGARFSGGGGTFPARARMAEVAIYNTTLSADEVKALARGMAPDKVSPQGLVLYTPLVRDLVDLKGNTLTNNGTTVVDHPRIYA